MCLPAIIGDKWSDRKINKERLRVLTRCRRQVSRSSLLETRVAKARRAGRTSQKERDYITNCLFIRKNILGEKEKNVIAHNLGLDKAAPRSLWRGIRRGGWSSGGARAYGRHPLCQHVASNGLRREMQRFSGFWAPFNLLLIIAFCGISQSLDLFSLWLKEMSCWFMTCGYEVCVANNRR